MTKTARPPQDEQPLDTLLRRIREGLNDPATQGPPEEALAIEFSRREWKVFRDALVHVKPT